MNKEFIPYEQALELKELGFNYQCFAAQKDNLIDYGSEMYDFIYNADLTDKTENWVALPIYQQAFRWFREKYKFTYSIGNTNIAVIHYLGTTQLLQNNDSYEAAELAAIKWFIDVAKQQENGKD